MIQVVVSEEPVAIIFNMAVGASDHLLFKIASIVLGLINIFLGGVASFRGRPLKGAPKPLIG